MSSINKIKEKSAGKVLVFTNGVFDILHAGHVSYLEQARALGDFLVVGLNSDDSVRRLGKGPERPINSLEDRMQVIRALRCVDDVVSFSEDTPVKIISQLQPNIHVKGGDYNPEDLPETSIIESYGGKVVIMPLLVGRSSTNVISKLRQSVD